MDRKKFLEFLAIAPLIVMSEKGKAMSGITELKNLNKMAENYNNTELMPVLFLGHGSPMNAIEDNEFSRGWQAVGKTLPKVNAILCISAHWETRGTLVTAMAKPETIHDFGGYPQALFDVQYPAPGDPQLAEETKEIVKKTEIGLDDKWGLDHGCWSVVKHLFPAANMPLFN